MLLLSLLSFLWRFPLPGGARGHSQMPVLDSALLDVQHDGTATEPECLLPTAGSPNTSPWSSQGKRRQCGAELGSCREETAPQSTHASNTERGKTESLGTGSSFPITLQIPHTPPDSDLLADSEQHPWVYQHNHFTVE